MNRARPLPVPDERSAPYWEAAADHVLVIARCSRCHRFSHPPDVVCPRCRHPGFAFEPVSGRGTICSWIVVRQSFLPGFDDDVPFVLVDVALDVPDDIRLIGRLVDGPASSPVAGDRVRTVFEDVATGVAVAAFALDSSS